MHTVAFSEVLLSRLCRLLLSRVSTHSGACFLGGASPPGGPLRLLRGSSSHGGPRRLLKGTSPPGDHHQLSGWDSLQSQDLAICENPFMGICVLQDAPTGNSSLHREIPISPDVGAMRRETLSPLNSSTHLGLRLKIPIKGSLEAYLQDLLITIRVVIFASWRKNLLVQNLMLRANTLALVFIWIMAPISAILQGLEVWLILLS